MFTDQSFSISVDQIECISRGRFDLREEVERRRQANWAAHLGRNPAAFDGSLLRLDAFHSDGAHLRIQSSRTCYSAYVATRHPDFAAEHPGCQRADPLGMTAVVLSADRQVIVTRRSLVADQNPGALYLIGGYADPPQGDGKLDLFLEIAREIREELAVTDLVRSASFAIGLAYDPVFCHPELFFLTASQSDAGAIIAGANQAPDRNEAAKLFVCPVTAFLANPVSLHDTPQTWSYATARAFLRNHMLSEGAIAAP